MKSKLWEAAVMLQSMTGYAEVNGTAEGVAWTWSARSINSRGLDLRIRVPEGFEVLEPLVRKAMGSVVSRGAVSVGLRLERDALETAPKLNEAALDAVLSQVKAVSARAEVAGVAVRNASVVELLSQRGVLEFGSERLTARSDIIELVGGDIETLCHCLQSSRRDEGEKLSVLLSSKIDEIGRLSILAERTAEARDAKARDLLRARLKSVLENVDSVDQDRLATELAMIAVKADVSEELDRLGVHVSAARDLLKLEGPVGRKLDFLSQEFNREANSLCSKAGTSELTAVGLNLKVAIDQLREQIQNVE